MHYHVDLRWTDPQRESESVHNPITDVRDRMDLSQAEELSESLAVWVRDHIYGDGEIDLYIPDGGRITLGDHGWQVHVAERGAEHVGAWQVHAYCCSCGEDLPEEDQDRGMFDDPVGIVTNLGYVYCAACAELTGDSIWADNSAYYTEVCDICGSQLHEQDTDMFDENDDPFLDDKIDRLKEARREGH